MTVAGPGQVTVVVISRDRRDDLLRSLPRHEAPVILVDNGSSDGTPAAIRSALPAVRVITLPANLGAEARNVGVRVAVTPYIAFADDDSWWDPGALARAAQILAAHPRVGLLAGRILVGEQARLDPLSAAMALAPLGSSPGGAGPDVLGFSACGAVVRRQAFLQTGGFDPVVHFPGEEERVALDLATRGWLLCYRDDLVARHQPSHRRHDQAERERLITRNALLTAVMRRPWPVVGGLARQAWRAAGPRRSGALAALPRVPAALRRRSPVPAAVEHRLRTLEAASRDAKQAGTGSGTGPGHDV